MRGNLCINMYNTSRVFFHKIENPVILEKVIKNM